MFGPEFSPISFAFHNELMGGWTNRSKADSAITGYQAQDAQISLNPLDLPSYGTKDRPGGNILKGRRSALGKFRPQAHAISHVDNMTVFC